MYARFVIAPSIPNPNGASDIDIWPNMPTNDCSSAGRNVYGGNPDVYIDPAFMGDNNPLSPNPAEENPFVLDFTGGVSFTSMGYSPLTDGGVGTGIAKVKTDSVVLYTGADLDRATAPCSTFPDPEKADGRSTGWIYSPYYEGASHPNWDPSSRSYLDAPVFAKVGADEYRIHDRRYLPRKNTPEEPISDGGGQMTLDSVFIEMDGIGGTDHVTLEVVDADDNPRTSSSISGEEQAVYCMNGRPNIFNEEFCVLSTEENACMREAADDEDTVTVVTLTPASLDKMKTYLYDGAGELLSKGVPAVITGLDFGVDNTPPYPCTMEKVSRWIQDAALSTETTCYSGSTTTVGDATKSAFAHLLKYAVSNNQAGIRDVRMVSYQNNILCYYISTYTSF